MREFARPFINGLETLHQIHLSDITVFSKKEIEMQMLFNSPLSQSKAITLIELLQLSQKNHVLDVGCGTGEFLIQVLERFGCKGTGVDIDDDSIVAAQSSSAKRIGRSRVNFQKTDVQKFKLTEKLFECGICLGSTHAFSMGEPAYPETLKGLLNLVSPNGLLLVGEGFWKKAPSPEYLEFIGEPVGVYRTHEENIERGEQLGLLPLYATTSSHDEWDDFEWRHQIRKEHEAASDPSNALKQETLKSSREWKKGYLRWGRDTLGFGFYLFQTPQ